MYIIHGGMGWKCSILPFFPKRYYEIAKATQDNLSGFRVFSKLNTYSTPLAKKGI